MTHAGRMANAGFGARDGETELAVDPETMDGDARIVFIGRIHSSWTERSACPKNMAAARESGLTAAVEIDSAYRQGLAGLRGASHVILLTWLDRAPRNLIVQKPRHLSEPKGVFSLRSPARPNPIGLHVAKLLDLDLTTGYLTIDAIDVLDRTPLLDVKPYLPSIDAFPDATRPDRGTGG